MSASETNPPTASNPYDEASEPILHAAWREGYRASEEGTPASARGEYENARVANAWVNGYTAADLARSIDGEGGGPSMEVRASSNGLASSYERRVNVVIIDDHPAIRTAVQRALRNTRDVELCGWAATVREGIRLMEERRPDVAIIDISLADGHGLNLVRAVKSRVPEVKTIVFSVYDEKVYAERALRAGASGYMMKTKPLDRLVTAIRNVQRGEVDLSQDTKARILNRLEGDGFGAGLVEDDLTRRELQVFQLLGQGRSVAEIQEQLGLTRKAVETYRRRARNKLGLDNVTELLHFAVRWTHAQGKSTDRGDSSLPPANEATE